MSSVALSWDQVVDAGLVARSALLRAAVWVLWVVRRSARVIGVEGAGRCRAVCLTGLEAEERRVHASHVRHPREGGSAADEEGGERNLSVHGE